MLVQARRPRGEAQGPGHGAEQRARDAGLRGHADLGHPLAAGVVHAAGEHHGHRLLRHPLVQHPLPRHGVRAASGEGGAHDGQLGCGDQDRALREVPGHGLAGRDGQPAGVGEQVGQAQVAVGAGALGVEDVLADLQLDAGQRAVAAQQQGRPLVLVPGGQEGVDQDGAGVDQRVARPAVVVQGQVVERLTGGLDAHVLQHVVQADLLQHHRVGEGLGDRLQREGVLGLPGGGLVAVHRAHRHGEAVHMLAGDVLEVVGGLAAAVGLHLAEHRAQVVVESRRVHSCHSSGRAPGSRAGAGPVTAFTGPGHSGPAAGPATSSR